MYAGTQPIIMIVCGLIVIGLQTGRVHVNEQSSEHRYINAHTKATESSFMWTATSSPIQALNLEIPGYPGDHS